MHTVSDRQQCAGVEKRCCHLRLLGLQTRPTVVAQLPSRKQRSTCPGIGQRLVSLQVKVQLWARSSCYQNYATLILPVDFQWQRTIFPTKHGSTLVRLTLFLLAT